MIYTVYILFIFCECAWIDFLGQVGFQVGFQEHEYHSGAGRVFFQVAMRRFSGDM